MYCENCGKKLIRGYQFCIECGTPVPPEDAEELNDQPGESDQTGAQSSEEMPGIKPLGSEEGTLVFCPTCGMRMQKSTEFCEKCGMKLTDNGPTNGGVPLVNTDPLGGDFSGMSEHDIAQIDNFVNNSGFDGSSITYGDSFQDNNGLGGVGDFGGGNLNSEIEALNQQFANLNSTSSDMPAISAPVKEPEPEPVPQPAEPDLGTLSRRVDDFSMEAGMPETQFLSESGLPVINGGEMTEPDVPVELEHHLDDINIDASEPAYSEPAAETPAYTEPAYTAPSKPEEPAEDAGVDLGKLIYCRNCGQDMYEKETVCKNCGSPNKWNEKPLKHSVSGGTAKEHKEPTKVFGIFPIPTVVGAGVVVAGLIALIVITTSSQNPGTDPDIVQNSVSFTSAAESDATSAPEENSDTDPVVTEPEDTQSDVSEPAVTDPISEPEDTSSDNSQSDVSEPEESTVPEESSAPENSSTPGHTTASSATSRASSAPAVVPPVTSSTKASVTSRATTPTTSTPAVSSKPSATVSSEDKQRAKMIDAFEAISAEVGKVHVYAQATEFAIEEGKTKTFYTSAMTSTLSSGKTNAASLLKSAKPSSSELSSAYSALEKLYDLYSEYYNYVTTTSDTDSKFTSNETKKWDAFNTSVKNNFNYSKLQTKNQTEADKSRTYADIMTSASTAASNAVSQFTTVKSAVENIKSSKYDSDVMTTIYNNKTSSMLKAAGYAQLVTNYYGLLNSGVPSAYSSAKNALSTASSEADELLAVFTQAGYNDLSGFKTESNNSIKAVNNAINSINKAL